MFGSWPAGPIVKCQAAFAKLLCEQVCGNVKYLRIPIDQLIGMRNMALTRRVRAGFCRRHCFSSPVSEKTTENHHGCVAPFVKQIVVQQHQLLLPNRDSWNFAAKSVKTTVVGCGAARSWYTYIGFASCSLITPLRFVWAQACASCTCVKRLLGPADCSNVFEQTIGTET